MDDPMALSFCSSESTMRPDEAAPQNPHTRPMQSATAISGVSPISGSMTYMIALYAIPNTVAMTANVLLPCLSE